MSFALDLSNLLLVSNVNYYIPFFIPESVIHIYNII